MRFFNLRSGTVRGLLGLLLLIPGAPGGDAGLPTGVSIASLTSGIPRLVGRPLTGTQFARLTTNLDERQRELVILNEILGGNVPGFLRKLVPVELRYQPPAGRFLAATVFVMPEYLAIGPDQDFLRIPMNLHTAAAVATHLGFVLPTRKMVDAIYRQAAFRFSPEPMTPGPQMRSTEYYRIHNAKIEEQFRALGIMPGELVSGDKKDVVMTRLLERNPGHIAIYGWHRPDGTPIQPLSTVHGACYADYSHGIRLVSETALVNGQKRSIYDVLRDPALAPVLSDDGPIPDPKGLMTRLADDDSCGVTLGQIPRLSFGPA